MWLGVIDFSEKHANIGTLFWATVSMKRESGRVTEICCFTRASSLTHFCRDALYSRTASFSSVVVGIHAGDCPCTGSISISFVPCRYPISPHAVSETSSRLLHIGHCLPEASSFGTSSTLSPALDICRLCVVRYFELYSEWLRLGAHNL